VAGKKKSKAPSGMEALMEKRGDVQVKSKTAMQINARITEITPEQFFAQIWPERLVSKEFLELRIINRANNSIQRNFFSNTTALLDHARRYKHHEVYFGVSTRWGQSGTKRNCFRVRAVWMDFDNRSIDDALDLDPKPNIVVSSGNGIHVYWLLETPVLVTNGAWEKIEAINRGLCKKFGGDSAAIDVSRILRIPGFQNHKYTPAREVHAYAL
jgi:hypothetical protein